MDLPGRFALAKDLGNSRFQLGDLEGATKCYVRALGCGDASNADRVIASTNLAQCALRRGRPREALDWCERALTDDPGHVKSLYRKGLALELLGDLLGAQRALRRADQRASQTDPALAVAKIHGDISTKLRDVTARLEQQHQQERADQAACRRARDAEIESLRPSMPAPTAVLAAPGTVDVADGHYRETDWTPWLRRLLCERSEGDPEKRERLRVNTTFGLCMAYVPDRLPPGASIPPWHGLPPGALKDLPMISSGMPSMPVYPPTGKEVSDRLARQIVTGEVALWRRGSRSGLRYDFRVLLFWRAIELQRIGGDDIDRLEGTIVLEVNDEVQPSEWALHIHQDLDLQARRQEKRPTDKVFKSLLDGARLLGERARATVKDLLEELRTKGVAE